jgi:hypothetical protein
MVEFLIRRTDGEWFDLKVDQMAEALCPTSFEYRRAEGSGDWRIHTQGVDVSFSYEDPGIQISFEGEISEALAEAIVEEIRINLQRVTGQKGRIVPI